MTGEKAAPTEGKGKRGKHALWLHVYALQMKASYYINISVFCQGTKKFHPLSLWSSRFSLLIFIFSLSLCFNISFFSPSFFLYVLSLSFVVTLFSSHAGRLLSLDIVGPTAVGVEQDFAGRLRVRKSQHNTIEISRKSEKVRITTFYNFMIRLFQANGGYFLGLK